jgi:hypothetical protein
MGEDLNRLKGGAPCGKFPHCGYAAEAYPASEEDCGQEKKPEPAGGPASDPELKGKKRKEEGKDGGKRHEVECGGFGGI